MSAINAKESFLRRIQNFLQALGHFGSFLDTAPHDLNDLFTRANLLYNHSVQLEAANIVEYYVKRKM